VHLYEIISASLRFILDIFLLISSIFLLSRRRRVTGKVGFSLLMDSGLWKTVGVGIKKGIILLIVPPLLEYLCLRLLEAGFFLVSGHPTALVSQVRSQVLLETEHEFSWARQLIWFGMIELVILGPIAEEAFTRGFLYLAMRERWSVKTSMMLNALLFAALHFTPYGFIGYFFTGLLLCYFFERTRSLLVPIIGHMVSNIPPFLVLTGVVPFPGR